MNEQNQSIANEDLNASNAEEIKGGVGQTIRLRIASVNNSGLGPALGDLEPQAEIKGGAIPGLHKVSDVTLKRGVIG